MHRTLKVTAIASISTLGLLFGAIRHGQTLRAEEPLRLLPRTAHAVLRVDTRMLARTEAAKLLVDKIIPGERLSDIEATCAWAPFEALSQVIVWVRGPEDQLFQSIGLMLRGRTVDAASLLECHRRLVEARGGSVARLEGPAGPFMESRDQQSAAAALDARTIVTGSAQTVTEALAVRQDTMPALIERAGVRTLWSRIAKGAGIAAVFEPPERWIAALGRVMELDGGSALEGARSLALSVPAGNTRTIDLYIVMADRGEAEQDAKRLRAWLASPPQSVEPPWTDVLRAARLEVREETIRMTVDVSSLAGAP